MKRRPGSSRAKGYTGKIRTEYLACAIIWWVSCTLYEHAGGRGGPASPCRPPLGAQRLGSRRRSTTAAPTTLPPAPNLRQRRQRCHPRGCNVVGRKIVSTLAAPPFRTGSILDSSPGSPTAYRCQTPPPPRLSEVLRTGAPPPAVASRSLLPCPPFPV